jgi:hypothetical protein
MLHVDRLRSSTGWAPRASRGIAGTPWILAAAIGGAALFPAIGRAQPAPAPEAAAAAAGAEERFYEGQKLYAAGQFEEALKEIRASYAVVPSPNSHLYIARCLRQLGRVAEAYDEYAQVIVEAADRGGDAKGRYAPTQKAAAEERAALKNRVASVAIVVPADVPNATVRIGEDPVAASRLGQPVTVAAGAVSVRAEAPGRKPFEWSGDVPAGESRRVEVSLLPMEGAVVGPDQPPSEGGTVVPKRKLPLRPLAFVSAGVGVVGLALWGILGTAASSRYDDLEVECGGRRCGPDQQDSVDAGRTESTVSTVGLVVGVAGLAGAVVLWIVGAPDEAPPAKATTSVLTPRAAAASLRLGVRPGFLTVEGAF